MQKKEPKYENGIIYWKCPTCNSWLPESAYYHNSQTVNKLRSQCKTCHTKGSIETRNPDNKRRLNREYMRRARAEDPEKFRKRGREQPPAPPEKVHARTVLNGAVVKGELDKPKQCPKCGSGFRINGHHPDYGKPLEVEWMCPLCHAEYHRGLGD